MGIQKNASLTPRFIVLVVCCVFIGIVGTALSPRRVSAAPLTNRFVQIASSVPSAVTQYTVGFTVSSTYSLGSIVIQFCNNTPEVPVGSSTCDVIPGFDASSATLSSQQGAKFSITHASQDEITLGQSAFLTQPPLILEFTFANITNPSNTGEYYARISTYSSVDGSGTAIDSGGTAMTIPGPVSVKSYVPPYLEFCVGLSIPRYDCGGVNSGIINLGDLSSHKTSIGTSQMLVGTNAANGYSITIQGITMTAGNNVIPAMAGTTSQLGTSQFGINLTANTNPLIGSAVEGPGSTVPNPNYTQPNHFRFHSGDTLVTSTNSDDFRKYTVSYIVNVSPQQPPGRYAATITYICLANF